MFVALDRYSSLLLLHLRVAIGLELLVLEGVEEVEDKISGPAASLGDPIRKIWFELG